MPLHMRQQFVETAFRLQRFEHQFNRAAAGQAELLRLFGGYAVLRGRGFVLHQLAIAYSEYHVVLDAAAGNRANQHAVIAYCRQRTDGPWRGTPGFHYGGHHHTMPGLYPVAR